MLTIKIILVMVEIASFVFAWICLNIVSFFILIKLKKNTFIVDNGKNITNARIYSKVSLLLSCKISGCNKITMYNTNKSYNTLIMEHTLI